jgi:hypothetical protein
LSHVDEIAISGGTFRLSVADAAGIGSGPGINSTSAAVLILGYSQVNRVSIAGGIFEDISVYNGSCDGIGSSNTILSPVGNVYFGSPSGLTPLTVFIPFRSANSPGFHASGVILRRTTLRYQTNVTSFLKTVPVLLEGSAIYGTYENSYQETGLTFSNVQFWDLLLNEFPAQGRSLYLVNAVNQFTVRMVPLVSTDRGALFSADPGWYNLYFRDLTQQFTSSAGSNFTANIPGGYYTQLAVVRGPTGMFTGHEEVYRRKISIVCAWMLLFFRND